MERRTKHRLLGIFVMIGLVILLLPLFQSSKDDATDSAMLAAPPFPNQQPETVAAAPAADPAPDPGTQALPINTGQENQSAFNQQPDDTINLSQRVPAVQQSQPTVNQQSQSSAPGVNTTQTVKQPGDLSADNNPTSNTIAAAPKSSDTVMKQEDDESDVKDNVFRNSYKQQETNGNKSAARVSSKKINSNAKKITSKAVKLSTKQNLDKDGLFKIRTSAWVIQLGSYRNKNQALKLVNKLRSRGYHAFIQQIADNTSVFVGPENKQENARALATQLAADMHLQGFVISYKPLTL